MTAPTQPTGSLPRGRETTAIQNQATVVFTAAIGGIGAVMMTLTSSPTAKGASFLWLPAALQLMAGVWLGPWRGLLAGGLGAYLAGILAYGGWGPIDIIMNPVAGGLANSMLPALLFSLFKIDPALGTKSPQDLSQTDLFKGAGRIILMLSFTLIIPYVTKLAGLGQWGYGIALLFLLLTLIFLRDLSVHQRQFIGGIGICIFISAISALIGVGAQKLAGQSWEAALLTTGVGWFLGDTVSSVLGLYALASFTHRAREAGVATR